MSYLTLISALIAILGIAFAITGIRRLLQRRVISALGLEVSALGFFLLASSSILLASNFYTYDRLIYEQPVAEISFQQIEGQSYNASIQSMDSPFNRSVVLNGDEWQLDAQVLTWHGVANLFGMDANYRLHRISGRYLDINLEQQNPRSVYSLVKKQVPVENDFFDLWDIANRYRGWVKWVDAAYGSAVFLPMTDGARYKVSISRTGLIARPDNVQAREAVSNWIGL